MRATSPSSIRLLIKITGQVQGVGFRPHAWRLAQELQITGHIANTAAGVELEIQGTPEILRTFLRKLQAELPPLARIDSVDQEVLPCQPEDNFSIIHSKAAAPPTGLIPPDIALCPACRQEILNPAERRHNYAFTNCTNCGPRFSITHSLPYDRASTSMACFPMCPECLAEYTNPGDRRFHAQPVACPVCGPGLWLVTAKQAALGRTLPDRQTGQKAIAMAARMLLAGKIVAIRGLGGFQLACDARNSSAVRLLRQRKNRPHKALAVMVKDLETIRTFCELPDAQAALLQSPAAPVTLCPKRAEPQHALSDAIAPDTGDIGIMLAYTPLHALLLDWLAKNGMPQPVLVMTSANPAGEPICLGNREALERLRPLADAWLLHDRDILCRVDDSVVAQGQQGPLFLRRSRGYAPQPITLAISGPPVLGTGAELKATFCLTRHNEAFLSQHIGDLQSPACMDFYEQALTHLQNLLAVKPAAIVRDLHPDFLSSRFAKKLAAAARIPIIPLQHHVAHAMACLADNHFHQPALALCLDGSGLGEDETIWGGELLLLDPGQAQWKRLGHLTQMPLPGGEMAIKEPWRLAVALQWQTGQLPAALPPAAQAVAQMLEHGVNCPLASSCGRLFDAIAAMAGICEKITYEGQAAIRLEKKAAEWLQRHAPPTPRENFISGANVDSQKIFAAATRIAGSASPGEVAAWFHVALANSLAQLAAANASKYGIAHVALTGGVLQNRLLERYLRQNLLDSGLHPLTHASTPPGDGSIALGQAAWGQCLRNR